MSRIDRYPSVLLIHIDAMIQKLIPLIVNKHRELPNDCRLANIAIAHFLRVSVYWFYTLKYYFHIEHHFQLCLSLTDRGTIFQLIHFSVDKFDQNESRVGIYSQIINEFDLKALRDYKLELLHIISQHEHWLPLCLPLLCNRNGSIINKSLLSANSDPPSNANNRSGFLSRFFTQLFGASAVTMSGNGLVDSNDRCLLFELYVRVNCVIYRYGLHR